jgi:predicted regulator of Ras-like GTPase activity (Roadblock/LC7/MglB family)
MKSKGKFLISIVAAFSVLTILTTAAFAVPQTINYQGYLEDSGGTPVNTTMSMAFAIYNAPTGGTPLWSETQGSVTVTEGAFSVTLGIANAIDLPFDEQYYLGVNVNGDGEMTPRAELASIPYAFRANVADAVPDGVVTSAMIVNGSITDADISPTASIAASKIVQGAGSTLDADLLDGVDSTGFLDKATYDAGADGKGDVANNAEKLEGYTLNDLIALLDGRYLPKWIITTVDSAGYVGQYTSIANGADGLPIVSYFDNTNQDLQDLKVVHCGDASCSPATNTITTVDSAGIVGQYTSIAVGADGLPVVSYYDWTNKDLNVLHCGDAVCTPATNTINTVDSAGDVGKYTSIAVGADNLPVVSYLDNTNYDLKVLHCGDAVCTPATNTINTVDSAGVVGVYTSIAIGADGLPVVSYWDSTNSDLKVAHCGDAACSSGNTITTVDSAGQVGIYTSIAVGADNLPVVSYYDVTNGDLKVAHCGDASCSAGNTITTVDSAEWVGQYTSIVVGADGLPVISYYDNANQDLKVGWWTSIAVGADGLPVISYFDVTNGDLKVAHCADAACAVW